MSQPDIASNPFTPSFGRVPPILIGRSKLIADMMRAFDSSGDDPRLCTVITGQRGTGKTALISYLSDEAQGHGWISANVSALPGMLEDIIERATEAADEFVRRSSLPRIKALNIGELFGIEWEYHDPASGNWRTRMNRLLDELAEVDVGLLITVDEVVGGFDELRQLAAVFQHFVRENRRVALIMAGLPANVSALLEDRSVSFLLRSNQQTLDILNGAEVNAAVRRTIHDAGREIDDDALATAVEAMAGFPYLVQLVGFYSWEASPENVSISLSDVEYGVENARRDFSNSILARVWGGLSGQERAFLQAMAQDDSETSRMSDIARRMGKSESYARVYRKRLVEQDVIRTTGRGRVSFDLPLLREFVRETDAG